jgi:hypothetical protein
MAMIASILLLVPGVPSVNAQRHSGRPSHAGQRAGGDGGGDFDFRRRRPLARQVLLAAFGIET